jgi:hypothetical protein
MTAIRVHTYSRVAQQSNIVALEKVNRRVPVWSPLIKEFRGRFETTSGARHPDDGPDHTDDIYRALFGLLPAA